jgi:hypothetical protein
MKKPLVVLAVVLLATAAWGHQPPDRTFLAFQWPDNAIPTLDGNIQEWEIIPEVYAVTIENDLHESLYSIEVDKSDFDVRGWVAYNPNIDKLIMASRVYDDYHERDNTDPGQCMCIEDGYEMVVDGDHAGDPYRLPVPDDATDEERQRATNSVMQWWSIAAPPVGGRMVQSGNTGQWQHLPPYFEFTYSFDGEEHGESTYYYEMAFYAWDDLDFNGPETSTPTDLVEGNVVGINAIWMDWDGPLTDQPLQDNGSTVYDGYWITGGPCCNGDNASDWLLAPVETDLFEGPTAVETETWGRLKARFQ